MEQASMDVAEIRLKIDECSRFISATLRPQLEAAVKAREEVERDIKEYEALQAKLANMTSTAKSTREKILSDNTCSRVMMLAKERRIKQKQWWIWDTR